MHVLVRIIVTADLVVAGKLAIDELTFEGVHHSPVLGGSAAHVAMAAATVGSKVAVVSAIGDDFPKEFILMLEKKGVDLSGVIRRPGRSSHFWADFRRGGIMTNYRLHFGVGNQLSFRHFSKLTEKTRAVHLGILPPHIQRKLIKRIHRKGKLISMTTIFHQAQKFQNEILTQLPYLDILFLNEREATFLTREDDILVSMKSLGELVPVVVVTQGSKGCMVNFQGKIRHFPSYHTIENDATGAGDSFAGAFLASYLQEGDINQAAKWGNAAGALNVREVGCTCLARATRQTLEKLITNSH